MSINNQLICGRCGEIGRVVSGHAGHCVTAKCGDGGGLCRAHERDTGDMAIEAWVRLWADDEPADTTDTGRSE